MTVVAGKPWAPVRGKRMRLTRLNNLFAPDTAGPAAMGVSAGFISVKCTPQYDEGTKVQQFTANGDLCINEPGQLVLLNVQADIQFCGVDPDLYALITGQPVVVDGTGAGVGMRLDGGVPVTSGFGLEVWTGIAGNSATTGAGDGGTAWGYFLMPYLRDGKVSDFTLENGAANFTLTCQTRENPGWGVGPYKVVDTSATGSPVVPGPLLTAAGPKTHVHMQYVTVPPPAAVAGLTAVPAAGS